MALIYCVEDDDGIRELISCALKSGGYEVKAFPKAKPFYEEIRNKEPSLVLLDIMLPDEDGYSILSKLKKDSHTQDVPVIMLTAKSSELDKVSGLEMGADDYITKPFRVRELISRINAILRRKGKSQDSNKKILKFKNISIHTLEARVFKNNEEIFLTSAEYKLLLILIQNKNMVLSRAQILEKLWDVTYDFINDNTLSVYIKRLREKIEDDSSKPQYILTVRGLGYKWNGSDDNENTI